MIEEISDINIKHLVEKSKHIDSCNFRGVLKTTFVSWVYLPEDILLLILDMLNGKDLANFAKVCSHWRMIADRDDLWEKKFKQDFNINFSTTLRPGAQSWKKEYERFSENVPCVELDKIEEHADEVLHVSFSNNGMMFCTCSKDAYVKVYNADWPFNTVFSAHHGGSNPILNWKYTQLSQFSPCDTQLLVSGRSDVSEFGGEIVIYNIYAGMFSIQARVRIRPFDVMGTWLNECHILSAVAHQRYRTMQCLTEVILNKSAQDIENIYQSTVTRAFLFRSNNLSTLSYLQVADMTRVLRAVVKQHSNSDLKAFLHPMHYEHLTREDNELHRSQLNPVNRNKANFLQTCDKCGEKLTSENKAKRFKFGSSERPSPPTCFSFCSRIKPSRDGAGYLSDSDPDSLLKSCGVSASDTVSIDDVNDVLAPSSARLNDVPQTQRPFLCVSCGKPVLSRKEELDYSSATSGDEESLHIPLPRSHKLLLCFTGLYSCIPHQIGVKIIHQEECSKVAERQISEKLKSPDSNRPEVDDWERIIELRGHGIGMTLSPCGRYLYVNVRKWEGDWRPYPFRPHLNPPALSSQVDVVVYDLLTLELDSTLNGHTSEDRIFFIHLSANDLYVASGSGDGCGYIWDRHYQQKLAVLPHEDVVNCVAVNPRDPSMAVSVSDDKSIKIWRSKAFRRMLKGARPKARIKLRSHYHCHVSKV